MTCKRGATREARLAQDGFIEIGNCITMRVHQIPTPQSGPYIITEGPDGAIWFCESTAARIARLDPQSGRFDEFPLRDPDANPIGIITGADGCLWFTQKKSN